MSNQSTYNSEKVVKEYCSLDGLQEPEKTILKHIEPKLSQMRILDLGVGGGRTTPYFGFPAKEYVGVDYSPKMVQSCLERFSPLPKNISFFQGDARSLSSLRDSSFDFILFSFNGIDYSSHQDRLLTLQEIKRVCRSKGNFFFSTHNLQAVDKLFIIQKTLNPAKMLWRVFRNYFLRLNNQKLTKIKQSEYSIINDGAHNFNLKTHYISPKFQINELKEAEFSNVKVYGLNGQKIVSAEELDSNTDGWLYYFCQR